MSYSFFVKNVEVLIDEADKDLVLQYKWRLKPDRKNFYIQAHVKINGKYTTISLHRLLMGFPIGMQVDHINRNTLDNRRTNLRICNHGENVRNRESKHKYPNIKITNKGKYHVRISYNKKRITVGTFLNLEDAIIARDTYIMKLHKEFGVTIQDKIMDTEQIKQLKVNSLTITRGKSNHTGIDMQKNRWRARIRENGVRITLGSSYLTEEDAITAYNKYIHSKKNNIDNSK